ncbi:hypothetical protein SprV_0100278300 [Sparganum proliferum]
MMRQLRDEMVARITDNEAVSEAGLRTHPPPLMDTYRDEHPKFASPTGPTAIFSAGPTTTIYYLLSADDFGLSSVLESDM